MSTREAEFQTATVCLLNIDQSNCHAVTSRAPLNRSLILKYRTDVLWDAYRHTSFIYDTNYTERLPRKDGYRNLLRDTGEDPIRRGFARIIKSQLGTNRDWKEIYNLTCSYKRTVFYHMNFIDRFPRRNLNHP